MAVVIISEDLDKKEFQGYSTDTKPTLESKNTGSEFLELDTGSFFTWHINAWVEL